MGVKSDLEKKICVVTYMYSHSKKFSLSLSIFFKACSKCLLYIIWSLKEIKRFFSLKNIECQCLFFFFFFLRAEERVRGAGGQREGDYQADSMLSVETNMGSVAQL